VKVEHCWTLVLDGWTGIEERSIAMVLISIVGMKTALGNSDDFHTFDDIYPCRRLKFFKVRDICLVGVSILEKRIHSRSLIPQSHSF
jgi:hypothetical protein